MVLNFARILNKNNWVLKWPKHEECNTKYVATKDSSADSKDKHGSSDEETGEAGQQGYCYSLSGFSSTVGLMIAIFSCSSSDALLKSV